MESFTMSTRQLNAVLAQFPPISITVCITRTDSTVLVKAQRKADGEWIELVNAVRGTRFWSVRAAPGLLLFQPKHS